MRKMNNKNRIENKTKGMSPKGMNKLTVLARRSVIFLLLVTTAKINWKLN